MKKFAALASGSSVPLSPPMKQTVRSAPELSGLLQQKTDITVKSKADHSLETQSTSCQTPLIKELRPSLESKSQTTVGKSDLMGTVIKLKDSLQSQECSIPSKSAINSTSIFQPVKSTNSITTITVPTTSQMGYPTHTPVHVTTESTPSQIQQLLSTLAHTPTSSHSSSLSRSLSSGLTISPSYTASQPQTFDAGTTMLKVTTAAPTTAHTDEDQVQAIQKLQFHDFPLTTVSLTKTTTGLGITQAKILTNTHLNLTKLQGRTDTNKSSSINTMLPVPSSSGSDAAATATATVSLTPTEVAVPGTGLLMQDKSQHIYTSANTDPTGLFKTASIPPRVTTKEQEALSTVDGTQTLGKVASILESPVAPLKRAYNLSNSVVTPQTKVNIGKMSESDNPTRTVASISIQTGHCSSSQPATATTKTAQSRTSTTMSSYASTAKPIMPTIASTRTRRIRTPKQYDL